MSALTGVGPSIASGNHVCSGICADFATAPPSSPSATRFATVELNSPPRIPKSSELPSLIRRKKASAIVASPIAFITNAFLAAALLVVAVHVADRVPDDQPADAADDQHHEDRERVDQHREAGLVRAAGDPRPGGREELALGGVAAEQADERRQRAAEGDEARRRRQVAGGAARESRPPECDQARRSERREQADPGAPDHQPRRVLSRSTSSVTCLRFSATTRPRPTTTSDAATAITASAKICPPPSPRLRAKPIRARFAPLSMISSDSRTISGLRRSSTPSAPVANRKPATHRYQATSGPSSAITATAPRQRRGASARRG